MYRKTILNDIYVKGVGSFSGKIVNVKLSSAISGSGIRIIRKDLKENNIINVNGKSNYIAERYSTTISNGFCKVSLIEHLFSALWCFQITDIDIEVDCDEIPLLDGSCLYWIIAIESAGIKEYNDEVKIKYIKDEIKIQEDDKFIIVKPCNHLKINYTIDFKNNLIGKNSFTFDEEQNSYIKELSMARTFCLEEHIEEHKKNKKNFLNDNIIIFGKNSFSIFDNSLRFKNEPTRHKILDFIGDLMSSGEFICGDFTCYKSGHKLNIEMLNKILSI